MHYYTSLITTLFDLVERTGTLTKEYIPLQSSLLIMLHLKENSGLLRAEGASVLAQKSMNYQRFNALISSNTAFKEAFNALSYQEFSVYMQEIDNAENTQLLRDLENDIISGSKKVKPSLWFEKISLKIEAYNELISKIVLEIDTSASEQRDESLLYMIILWVSLFIVFLIAFAISFTLKQSIVKPIETFTLAMKRLEHGDKTYFDYTYLADDAIKEMISAFENFRRSLIKSELAEILLEIKGKKADAFERLSHIDPLTNTLNRRKFRDLYEYEFLIAEDTNSPLCLLAFDLDKFKAINDTYGHEVGDKVLIAFADEVKKMIRPTDYLARSGGEEFLLLLTMTEKQRAIEIAQRICENVEKLNVCHVHKELRVTVSIGVGVYTQESSMDSIIRQADENLYRAKAEGRNRVSF
jgi:diguanylate cyclase (GGDEF)-like protein